MRDNQIPILNHDFKLEKFDNEILLYSITDTRAVYLNETAYLVYGLCNSGQTVGAIIALLEEAYPDQKDTIREDVTAALSLLQANGSLLLHE